VVTPVAGKRMRQFLKHPYPDLNLLISSQYLKATHNDVSSINLYLFINDIGYNNVSTNGVLTMCNYLDQAKVQAHFEKNPLSKTAINILKVDAVNAFLSFDSDREVCFHEVYDFLDSIDIGAEEFEANFENKFGTSLSPIESFEGESVERLAFMIFEHFDSALKTLKVIIAEREIH
jgi:hypothetical protein